MLFPLPIYGIMELIVNMNNEKKLPKRKDIRLKGFDYGSPGAYFVTICTEKRKNFFGTVLLTQKSSLGAP